MVEPDGVLAYTSEWEGGHHHFMFDPRFSVSEDGLEELLDRMAAKIDAGGVCDDSEKRFPPEICSRRTPEENSYLEYVRSGLEACWELRSRLYQWGNTVISSDTLAQAWRKIVFHPFDIYLLNQPEGADIMVEKYGVRKEEAISLFPIINPNFHKESELRSLEIGRESYFMQYLSPSVLQVCHVENCDNEIWPHACIMCECYFCRAHIGPMATDIYCSGEGTNGCHEKEVGARSTY